MDRNRFSIWVFASLGALFLIGGIAWLVYDYRQVAEAKTWPSVEGRVESASLASRQTSGRRRRTEYEPRIEYRYVVNGTTYSNHYIWLTGSHSFSSFEAAQGVLNAYPAGRPVRVFYAPADPRRSALNIESEPFIGLVFAPLGLLLLGLAWWIRQRTG